MSVPDHLLMNSNSNQVSNTNTIAVPNSFVRPYPQQRAQRRRKTPEEIAEAEQIALTRKRTPKLSINDKVKIIFLHKYELKSYSDIGSIFRCTKSTISGIIKNSNEILEKASKLTEGQSKTKCRIKQSCSYPDVEVSLIQWLNHPTVKTTKISDKEIRERAREECQRIYNQDWVPSNGWLAGFKARLRKKEAIQFYPPPEVQNNSDLANYFVETDFKNQSKWIEKIRETTWEARPELPMRHLIEKMEDDSNQVQNMGLMLSHEHMAAYDAYIPHMYTNIPRMNMEHMSASHDSLHVLPY